MGGDRRRPRQQPGLDRVARRARLPGDHQAALAVRARRERRAALRRHRAQQVRRAAQPRQVRARTEGDDPRADGAHRLREPRLAGDRPSLEGPARPDPGALRARHRPRRAGEPVRGG